MWQQARSFDAERTPYRMNEEQREVAAYAATSLSIYGAFEDIGESDDFYFDPAQMAIYFHGAADGLKQDLIDAHNKVCFSFIDEGEHRDGDWALWFKSLVILGTIEAVEDREEALHFCTLLGNKYYPAKADVQVELEKAFARTKMLKLSIKHMTGKTVHEK